MVPFNAWIAERAFSRVLKGAASVPAAASLPVVLYGVTVWVGWTDGGSERDVRLDTEQVSG